MPNAGRRGKSRAFAPTSIDKEAMAEAMGVNPEREPEVFAFLAKALDHPLPEPWTEHADKKGRVFYWNPASRHSSWSHPLATTHKFLIQAYRRVVEAEDRRAAFQNELEAFHAQGEEELNQWRVSHAPDGTPYYYKTGTQQTRWDNPRDELLTHMEVRIRMLSSLFDDEPTGEQLQLADIAFAGDTADRLEALPSSVDVTQHPDQQGLELIDQLAIADASRPSTQAERHGQGQRGGLSKPAVDAKHVVQPAVTIQRHVRGHIVRSAHRAISRVLHTFRRVRRSPLGASQRAALAETCVCTDLQYSVTDMHARLTPFQKSILTKMSRDLFELEAESFGEAARRCEGDVPAETLTADEIALNIGMCFGDSVDKAAFHVMRPLFLAPLPSPWESLEHPPGRIYFFHAGVREQRQRHPMSGFFVEVLTFLREQARVGTPLLEPLAAQVFREASPQFVRERMGVWVRKPMEDKSVAAGDGEPTYIFEKVVNGTDSSCIVARHRLDDPRLEAAAIFVTRFDAWYHLWCGFLPKDPFPFVRSRVGALATQLCECVVVAPGADCSALRQWVRETEKMSPILPRSKDPYTEEEEKVQPMVTQILARAYEGALHEVAERQIPDSDVHDIAHALCWRTYRSHSVVAAIASHGSPGDRVVSESSEEESYEEEGDEFENDAEDFDEDQEKEEESDEEFSEHGSPLSRSSKSRVRSDSQDDGASQKVPGTPCSERSDGFGMEEEPPEEPPPDDEIVPFLQFDMTADEWANKGLRPLTPKGPPPPTVELGCVGSPRSPELYIRPRLDCDMTVWANAKLLTQSVVKPYVSDLGWRCHMKVVDSVFKEVVTPRPGSALSVRPGTSASARELWPGMSPRPGTSASGIGQPDGLAPPIPAAARGALPSLGATDDAVDASTSSDKQAKLKVKIVGASGLRDADWAGTSDPYCVCRLPRKPDFNFQTQVASGNLNPEWNEEFTEDFVSGDTLEFAVFDSDACKTDELLGRVTLNSEVFLQNGFQGALPLSNAGGEGAVSVLIEVMSEVPQQSAATARAETHVAAVRPYPLGDSISEETPLLGTSDVSRLLASPTHASPGSRAFPLLPLSPAQLEQVRQQANEDVDTFREMLRASDCEFERCLSARGRPITPLVEVARKELQRPQNCGPERVGLAKLEIPVREKKMFADNDDNVAARGAVPPVPTPSQVSMGKAAAKTAVAELSPGCAQASSRPARSITQLIGAQSRTRSQGIVDRRASHNRRVHMKDVIPRASSASARARRPRPDLLAQAETPSTAAKTAAEGIRRFLSRTCGTMQEALTHFQTRKPGRILIDEWEQGLKQMGYDKVALAREIFVILDKRRHYVLTLSDLLDRRGVGVHEGIPEPGQDQDIVWNVLGEAMHEQLDGIVSEVLMELFQEVTDGPQRPLDDCGDVKASLIKRMGKKKVKKSSTGSRRLSSPDTEGPHTEGPCERSYHNQAALFADIMAEPDMLLGCSPVSSPGKEKGSRTKVKAVARMLGGAAKKNKVPAPTDTSMPSSGIEAEDDPPERVELIFEHPFEEVGDHDSYKSELLDGLCELGMPAKHVSRLQVALREGPTIAELSGPPSVMTDIRGLPLGQLRMRGCSAKASFEELEITAALSPGGSPPTSASPSRPPRQRRGISRNTRSKLAMVSRSKRQARSSGAAGAASAHATDPASAAAASRSPSRSDGEGRSCSAGHSRDRTAKDHAKARIGTVGFLAAAAGRRAKDDGKAGATAGKFASPPRGSRSELSPDAALRRAHPAQTTSSLPSHIPRRYGPPKRSKSSAPEEVRQRRKGPLSDASHMSAIMTGKSGKRDLERRRASSERGSATPPLAEPQRPRQDDQRRERRETRSRDDWRCGGARLSPHPDVASDASVGPASQEEGARHRPQSSTDVPDLAQFAQEDTRRLSSVAEALQENTRWPSSVAEASQEDTGRRQVETIDMMGARKAHLQAQERSKVSNAAASQRNHRRRPQDATSDTEAAVLSEPNNRLPYVPYARPEPKLLPWLPRRPEDVCKTYSHIFKLLQDPCIKQKMPKPKQTLHVAVPRLPAATDMRGYDTDSPRPGECDSSRGEASFAPMQNKAKSVPNLNTGISAISTTAGSTWRATAMSSTDEPHGVRLPPLPRSTKC